MAKAVGWFSCRKSMSFGDASEALARMTAHGAHTFWQLEWGFAGIRDEIRARVVGHHQLTDAVLLDLAIRHQGRLATFDRRILTLLPPESALLDAVAIIFLPSTYL